MPKSWQEGFEFYITHLEEDPASVFLDLNAAAAAPIASHPVMVAVLVDMRAPDENGLRTERESQALFALEDRVIAALAPLDALFVGRIVTGGRTDLFFYCPLAAAKQREAWVHRLTASAGEYTFQLTAKDDPEWSVYFDLLYPTAAERQLILNRQVVEALEESGDDLTAVRMVDHVALFPDEAAIARTLPALHARGFTTDAPTPPPPDGDHQMWSLEFHRRDQVTRARADEVTLELLELLEGSGAHYDGWGCVTVPARN